MSRKRALIKATGGRSSVENDGEIEGKSRGNARNAGPGTIAEKFEQNLCLIPAAKMLGEKSLYRLVERKPIFRLDEAVPFIGKNHVLTFDPFFP